MQPKTATDRPSIREFLKNNMALEHATVLRLEKPQENGAENPGWSPAKYFHPASKAGLG
jgi:hypothetical protein